jgi:hypothetical protein
MTSYKTSYKVRIPFIRSMGYIEEFVASESSFESVQDNALSYVNSMRTHDGLIPLKALPRYTTFIPVYKD